MTLHEEMTEMRCTERQIVKRRLTVGRGQQIFSFFAVVWRSHTVGSFVRKIIPAIRAMESEIFTGSGHQSIVRIHQIRQTEKGRKASHLMETYDRTCCLPFISFSFGNSRETFIFGLKQEKILFGCGHPHAAAD